MKILFISDNFPPEVNAPATRTFEHCVEWVKAGHAVTVLTSAPNFPLGKVYKGYKNRLYQTENIEGIRVIRVWTYIAENKGFIKRILDYLSFSFTSFCAGLKLECDVIVATSPQFFTALSGYFLAVLKRRPWVFELRDLWPDSIKTVGALKDGLLFRLLERLEIFLYKKADLIIPVTEAFKRNLVTRGITPQKQVVITNGCNLELFQPKPKNQQLLNKLGLEGKFVFSYIGTHGMAHSLEFIVAALEDLENHYKKNATAIHFLFIGAGARKQACLDLARTKNLQNITFLDPIPKEEVPAYISISDVCLAPLLRTETFKTVIPSKIFEAAAMHKPVLLGVEGQAKEIVDKYQSGMCYIPENKNDFIEKVLYMYHNPKKLEGFKEGCQNLARDYDRKRLAEQMLVCLIKTSVCG